MAETVQQKVARVLARTLYEEQRASIPADDPMIALVGVPWAHSPEAVRREWLKTVGPLAAALADAGLLAVDDPHAGHPYARAMCVACEEAEDAPETDIPAFEDAKVVAQRRIIEYEANGEEPLTPDEREAIMLGRCGPLLYGGPCWLLPGHAPDHHCYREDIDAVVEQEVRRRQSSSGAPADAGPHLGHTFRITTQIRGVYTVNGQANESPRFEQGFVLDVRAWDQSAALRYAAEQPLAAWTYTGEGDD